MKVLRFRFFDNDYISSAMAALNSMAYCLDIERIEDDAIILKEFKELMWYCANMRVRAGLSGHGEIEKDYFADCTLEWLDYVPTEWDNSETVYIVFNDDDTTTIDIR